MGRLITCAFLTNILKYSENIHSPYLSMNHELLCYCAWLFFFNEYAMSLKGLNIKKKDLESGEWSEEGTGFEEHSEVCQKTLCE